MTTETQQTRVLLSGNQTGGVIAMAESRVPAGWEGPPPHRRDFDETFYVLDGDLTFQLGEELVIAGPGALACAPGGTMRAVANRGERPARYLRFSTPAGPAPEPSAAGPRIGERGDLDRARRLPLDRRHVNVLLRGDEIVTRRAGGHAFVARGAVHTFANFGASPARTLIVCTPAGFERYFARIAAELAGDEVPAWALEPWPEVTKVGPPLGG